MQKKFFLSFYIDILCPFEVVEYFQNEGPSRFLMITSQIIYKSGSPSFPYKKAPYLKPREVRCFYFFLNDIM